MGFLPKPLFLALSLLFASAFGSGMDKSVLLKFKSSVSDQFGALSGWNSGGSDHCSWFGVLCDSNSRVLALNITGNNRGHGGGGGNSRFFPLYGYGNMLNFDGYNVNLVGTMSPELAQLTELRVLSLQFNGFYGEIPLEIWGMEKLEVLDLEGNSVSGSIPVRFGGLRSLRVLNLGFNGIHGEIPRSVSDCKGLQILNLAGNQVNGSIPGWLGEFHELRGLYLGFNRLGESIPIEIGANCTELEYLDLSGNFLVGGIPSSLGNCGNLRSLLLYSNLLEDDIPSELGRLKKLEVLDLSRNSLSGSIPKELGNCSELSVLVLSNLFNPIPITDGSSLGVSSSSTEDYNYFQGGIPMEIPILPKLKILWAPRATLEGKFPMNWGSCESLEMINLAQNLLTGEISRGLSRCINLVFLDLSSNRLSGELPNEIPIPCMALFDVSGNGLSGNLPEFRYGACPSVEFSNGYHSFFQSRTWDEINLPSMGSSGGGIAVFHNFGSNNFTGSIRVLPIAPDRLGKQTAYAFLAGENKITGSFPGNLFEKCDVLNAMILNVSNNRLEGSIPKEISSTCRSLVLLDSSVNQITGSIPDEFGNLSSLVALNLSWNRLDGPIPASLGRLKDLKYLSLSGNDLRGIIPSSLGNLRSLESLELSSNSLSGEIPKDLANLSNLTVLRLNNNKLWGQIPAGLVNMTTFTAFNVSFNNLSGPLSVPASDSQGRVGDSLNYTATPSGSPTQGSGKNSGLSSIEIASITSASSIVFVLVALFCLFIYTRKWIPKSRVNGSTKKEVTMFTEIGVQLTYENVVRATGIFNASNCIGNGGFGATYKAEVSPGVLVAIKRLSVGRFQGVQQFHAEIKTLGRLRHPNLVTLMGYHASETEMFLVYNYLPGGNLEKFIQERSTRAMDWRVLHKIALDISRALAYLHDQCVPRVVHRDVKPSNVLLDDDFNAYLSDFGLARLLGTSETHATTGVAGTFGYVAPEYAMTCRVSDKADVYSYGVVLLELMSDKKALDPSFSPYGNGFNIVNWACMLLRQGRAKEFFATGLWEVGPHDDLVEILHLAVMCTVDSLSTRPTMRQVVRRLKQLQPPSC